jgi:hypothetical protein
MIWPAIIGAVGAIGGGLLGSKSAKDAAAGMRYSPWNVNMTGVGGARFAGGQLQLNDSNPQLTSALRNGMMGQLDQFGQGQQNMLGQDYLRTATGEADAGSMAALQGLFANSGMPSFDHLNTIQSGLANPNSIYGINQGLPNDFFGNQGQFQQQAQQAQNLGSMGLQQAQGGYGGQNYLQAGQGFLNPYQQQNFSNLQGNMLTNFDPNQASSDYTNLLRQQAQPGEQQAAASALSRLHGSGRLGTTGGQNAYQSLMDSQNQADIGRQIAGQQHGLGQQLMAQQGRDAALTSEQNRQLGGFGANQQGMMNQYGLAQGLGATGSGLMGSAFQNAAMGLGVGQQADSFGYNRQMGQNQAQYDRGIFGNMTDFDRQVGLNQMGYDRSRDMNQMGFDRAMGVNQMGFDRANSLYTASNSATQDRFARAMQLFGGENALNQQFLGNFQGLLGSQQSQQQQIMDLSRIGASVGQSQTTANANAAAMRNQGNQDMIAGFMSALSNWQKNQDG